MAYYDVILNITKDYLGPAASRFVDRQINSHLRKSPSELQKGDIPMLAIRIRSGLMVLTRDENTVQEAYKRLAAVADE
jgi:hypothetical protein